MGTAIKKFMELAQQAGKFFEVGNTICNVIGNLWKFPRGIDQNVNNLKRKRDQLNSQKEDTVSRIKTELHPRKKAKKEVDLWFKNVKRINEEIRKLESEVGASGFFSRGFLVKDVREKGEEVEELIRQGRFLEGVVVDNPQWIGQVLSTTNLSGEAAKTCVKEIWQCLMDDEVRKIGVWGMGGVGKTSIMKLINNQLLNEAEKFDIVIWITVSKETSIAKLQDDIASRVGVTFSSDKDETRRAGMLIEALSQKSRFVMILDDLWENISLEKIGIPEPSIGSKLVLTTRSYDVCRRMDFKDIKLNPLVKEEAWNLFLEKLGWDILNIPGLEPIAKSIANHCSGLPLGVITVASCMKGIDDLSEWRNALKELNVGKKSVNGLEDEVLQQLKFSYDRLKDFKVQQCFLSCALYPEDFDIKEEVIIQLWIAEGLVEEMDSRQAEFDKGRAIMNRLINNCLLEVCPETGDGRCVKMHDLIRDMALHIASTKPRFLVKAGKQLTGPLHVQEWSKDLEKISLMETWGLQVLYPLEMSPPKCPILTTLLLSGCGIESIPKGFFKYMHGLKILDLSKNPLTSLPNSISNLKNLTALFLAYCEHLQNVPSLSNLRVLKELNLQGTNIKEIPQGMQSLSSLKYLNLSFTWLDEIPDGIFSRLSCLQALITGETLLTGEEVGELKKMEIFEGRFYDLHNLNQYAQALHGREEPCEYIILVGERRSGWEEIKTRKCIQLCGVNMISTNQIMFPCSIKELQIVNCNLGCSEEHPLFSKFIQVLPATFSSLKFLEIYDCRNMKKLFSPNCLPLNLQEFRVWGCYELEEIIASEVDSKEGRMVTVEFHLPQLRQLTLERLPELKSICSVDGVLVCDSLQTIRVLNCPKLKRMPLNLPQLNNARPSAPLSLSICIEPKKWWESAEWDHPNAKSLLERFVSFSNWFPSC